MENKTFGNVVIFGDSYSTFKGYIPEGQGAYYYPEGGETDVRRVEETWWHQVLGETNSHLVLNDSWAGAMICYRGYNDVDCSKTASFIARIRKNVANGFFSENKVDTVFVLGGTNDCWSNNTLGELKFGDFTHEELFDVLPAISCFMNELKVTFPNARIIWIINEKIKTEIQDAMIYSAGHYGIEYLRLKPFDAICGHPSIQGMKEIKTQLLTELK